MPYRQMGEYIREDAIESFHKTTCVKGPRTLADYQKRTSYCNSPALRDLNFSVTKAVS